MLEDTNSLDAAHVFVYFKLTNSSLCTQISLLPLILATVLFMHLLVEARPCFGPPVSNSATDRTAESVCTGIMIVLKYWIGPGNTFIFGFD